MAITQDRLLLLLQEAEGWRGYALNLRNEVLYPPKGEDGNQTLAMVQAYAQMGQVMPRERAITIERYAFKKNEKKNRRDRDRKRAKRLGLVQRTPAPIQDTAGFDEFLDATDEAASPLTPEPTIQHATPSESWNSAPGTASAGMLDAMTKLRAWLKPKKGYFVSDKDMVAFINTKTTADSMELFDVIDAAVARSWISKIGEDELYEVF